MVIVKGMTLKYPASTALALACAAHVIAGEATDRLYKPKLSNDRRKDKRRASRFGATRDRYLEEFGGLFAVGEGVEAQRAAIEQLRASAEARAEARAAIAKRYANEVIPPWGWSVRGFGQLIPIIEPVSLDEADPSAG